MEHQTTMPHNFFLNSLLTGTTLTTGFISANYTEQLKQIDIILSPIVKVCSIASFICFLIINRKTIMDFFKSKNK